MEINNKSRKDGGIERVKKKLKMQKKTLLHADFSSTYSLIIKDGNFMCF
jgi:hypothetical protein